MNKDGVDPIFQKKSFKELEIIGQFNKGFIIAQNDRNILVIDQHAADEKRNYEKQMN